LSIVKLSDYFVYLYSAFELLSLGVALHVLNKKNNPTYKLAWVIPILLFPVFGGLFYLLAPSRPPPAALPAVLPPRSRCPPPTCLKRWKPSMPSPG
jgi:hypothetical protein